MAGRAGTDPKKRVGTNVFADKSLVVAVFLVYEGGKSLVLGGEQHQEQIQLQMPLD